MGMTKDERLNWLKQIEKDICVCSLDATFDEIAKSCAIRSAIEELEERKTGRWKHKGGDEWECSECGYVISTEGSWEHPKEIGEDFCKHCGAKMEGAEE